MIDNPRFLSEKDIRNREIGARVGRVLFPTEIDDPLHGLDRAEELLEDGYGLVIASTHPSLLDLPRGLATIWRRTRFARTPTMLPIAYYQHKDKERIVDTASKWAAVPHYPIVTQDAIDKGKNVDTLPNGEKLPKGYGNMAFYRDAKAMLSTGGIVYFMPSAGIRSHLEPTQEKATENLFTIAKDSKTALLTVGVNFSQTVDYKQSDYRPHIGRKQTYTFGETYTNTEMQEFLERWRGPVADTRRPYAGLDDWIMTTQFPLLVDSRYRR